IGHACHILGLGLAAPASIRKTCALHPNDLLPYTHGVRHAWQRAPSHHCTTDAYGTTGEEKKVLQPLRIGLRAQDLHAGPHATLLHLKRNQHDVSSPRLVAPVCDTLSKPL